MVALCAKFAALIPFVAVSVRAVNDWSVKCKGSCSYDTNGTNGRAFATVSLAADNTKILSDITSAASWELLDCPADWSQGTRDVRLVCVADDPQPDCQDVTEGGAVNTIVRLPEECGTGPFAHIAGWGVSGDQSIPEGSTAARKLRLRKRDAPPSQVMVATLDWALSSVPADRGTIKLDIKASNSPATNGRIVATRSLKHALHGIQKRNLFGDIGDAIGDAADAVGDTAQDAVDGAQDVVDNVGDAVGDVADNAQDAAQDAVGAVGDVADTVGDAVGDAVDNVGDAVGDVVDNVGDAIGDINQVDLDNSGSLDTITVKDTFNLFDTSLSCSVGLFSFDATVSTSVDLDSQINVGFAFLMKGTVVPPAIDDFGLAAVMSGYAKGTIKIDALLSGDIDTGNIPVFSLGIPGLSLPGLLTLGPEAVINVGAGAGVDVNAAIAIPITWNFPLLDFVIPPSKGGASGDATESNTSVDFQASFTPGELNADAEVRIIPGLTFGINALAGFAEAEVFIEAEADGRLEMKSNIADDFSLDGCLTLSTGIDVRAGARGSFLSFFNDQTTIPIFNKRAELFKKCFGAGDGPASAVLDNGDGTFSNAAGDLVNENGELVDETGAVIPDNEAADREEEIAPILDEQGQPIADDQVILENGDNSFEDGLGNPTNADGQLLDDKGNLVGSELDLTGVKDTEGGDLTPEEVLIENEDGTFTASDGSQLDADGLPTGTDGQLSGAGMEPVIDEEGNPIPEDDIVFDNEDGTFSDFFGNAVDQWGGAIDIGNGTVVPTELAPEEPLEQPQQVDEPLPAGDSAPITLKTPEEVKKLAEDLLNAPPPAAAPAPRSRFRRSLSKRALSCQPSFVGPLPVLSVDQLVRFF